jgi:hypothetical protein
MRDDMRRIKEEWERKLQDEDLDHQKHTIELQTKNSL